MKSVISQLNRWLLVGLLSLLLVCCYYTLPVFSHASPDSAQVFESVWSTVEANFFDPDFNGVDWQKMRSQYQPQAARAKSTKELAVVINRMLGELNTSHTHFYTQAEPAYYQIAGIFRQFLLEDLKPFLADGKLQYTGIGVYTEEIENKTFIKAIINGSPAEQAKLKVGDELLSVEGKPFQAIQSFVGKADQEVPVLIRRTADGTPQEITVVPKTFNPATMFLKAVKDSVEIVEQDGKKIGYIHIWSYADDKYQEQLETELIYDRLRDTDGLVWDIRDGWGGAVPTYLNIFTAPVPTITSIYRDGVTRDTKMQWQKPVVMLVNQGSRSGKEILAYGFRKYGVGQIIGTQTAGAVVAGRPYIMPDGSLLYLAIANVLVDGERLEGNAILPDVRVPLTIPYAQGAGRPYIMPDGSLLYLAIANVLVDGERLEGNAILPDVRVPLTIPYAQGVDPQKEQAIKTVLKAISTPSS